MYLRSGRVTGGGQPAHRSQPLDETENSGSKTHERGRSVSPTEGESCPIPSLPDELVAKIFNYTTLADRQAQQCTSQRFRAVGNMRGIVEKQVINTCKGVPPALHGATADPALVALLEQKTHANLHRPQPAHLLLAGYMKVTPSRCLQTLCGHTGSVNRLVRLENGQIASFSRDMTIKIWERETGQCLKTLDELNRLGGHRNDRRFMISLGNNQLASCFSSEMVINILNIETGQPLKTLSGHSAPIKHMLDRGNGQLISCDTNGIIKIWNLETGQCLKTLAIRGGQDGHSEVTSGLALSRDRYLVSSSDDRTIKIWDLETELCLHSLGNPADLTDIVMGVSSLENGRFASCHHRNNVIKIWDAATGQCLKTLNGVDGHTRFVRGVTDLGNGQLASYSEDGTIKIWDSKTSLCLRTLNASDQPNTIVRDVCSLKNGQIASCSSDHKIKIWGY